MEWNEALKVYFRTIVVECFELGGVGGEGDLVYLFMDFVWL